ncbi:hypothetical protein AB4874_15090 [Thioclava sp. 15-R06ZXC-3]|uniref:Uncharacterized protein n=1 Tax=Thioclava arctica TaxID=3238301 RepID=A0ABV3TN07_9RHOB
MEEIAHANKVREFENTVFWQQGALPDRCLSNAHAILLTLSALHKSPPEVWRAFVLHARDQRRREEVIADQLSLRSAALS